MRTSKYRRELRQAESGKPRAASRERQAESGKSAGLERYVAMNSAAHHHLLRRRRRNVLL